MDVVSSMPMKKRCDGAKCFQRRLAHLTSKTPRPPLRLPSSGSKRPIAASLSALRLAFCAKQKARSRVVVCERAKFYINRSVWRTKRNSSGRKLHKGKYLSRVRKTPAHRQKHARRSSLSCCRFG